MVRHIVSWNFKPELTPQQRQTIGQEVVEKLTALKGKVPVLKDISVFCPPWTAAAVTWFSIPRWSRSLTCPCIRTTRSTRPSCP